MEPEDGSGQSKATGVPRAGSAFPPSVSGVRSDRNTEVIKTVRIDSSCSVSQRPFGGEVSAIVSTSRAPRVNQTTSVEAVTGREFECYPARFVESRT